MPQVRERILHLVMRYIRKVIRITAEDSPNVRLGMAQERQGMKATGEMLIPGVLPYHEYRKRRKHWDKIRQCVSLDARFYEGAEILMFPPLWLDVSRRTAQALTGKQRRAKGIGIDTAEGEDMTSMAATDEYGLIELVSEQTPDTNVIIGKVLAFMRKHNVPPEYVLFDRGGGGRQHADRLRDMGYGVRDIGFGENLNLAPRRGLVMVEERLDNRAERYAYLNRRAQMYHDLRLLLDPARSQMKPPLPIFAIPGSYENLRSELSPIPLLYDAEGRIRMLPKRRKNPDSKEKCLEELIGHSPDEADATVLSVHAWLYEPSVTTAGAF